MTLWIHYQQIEFIFVWSTSNCLHEQCLHPTYSNFSVAEVSCVCSDKSWSPWTQTILPYAKIPHCLWNGNCIILPGISTFGIDSSLPNARDLRNPWSYVSCKGIQITIVSDHLDNAGLNAIAKSSLSIRIKHLSKWDVTAQMSSLRFAVFCFLWLCPNVCIVCNDCIAV